MNKLYFNVKKCNIITYSRALAPISHDYEVDTAPMPRVNTIRDLGVCMTADLTFRNHIVDICKKAFRNLGFVLRQSRDFQNILTVKALYNALVRSRLESSAIIWIPHELKYNLMVEKIQNKFIKFLYLKLYGVYPFFPLMYPTLFVLGMVGYYKLEVRRRLALVTYIFKILRGKIHNSQILESLELFVPNRYISARSHHLFCVPVARTNLMAYAPVTCAIRDLNALSRGGLDIFNCSLSEFTQAALRLFSS